MFKFLKNLLKRKKKIKTSINSKDVEVEKFEDGMFITCSGELEPEEVFEIIKENICDQIRKRRNNE